MWIRGYAAHPAGALRASVGAARLGARPISTPTLRVSIVWSGQLDLNQRPPGSKPGTLIRLSYTQGDIHELTRVITKGKSAISREVLITPPADLVDQE